MFIIKAVCNTLSSYLDTFIKKKSENSILDNVEPIHFLFLHFLLKIIKIRHAIFKTPDKSEIFKPKKKVRFNRTALKYEVFRHEF
jgi:hypothetical protein